MRPGTRLVEEEVLTMTDLRTTGGEEDLRERAIARLKKKSDFRAHLLAFLLVNGFIVVIWAITSSGFFWPIFPIFGWGIGLVFNAWDVYREPVSEERIRREMGRLR
jgi:hypothetical protein